MRAKAVTADGGGRAAQPFGNNEYFEAGNRSMKKRKYFFKKPLTNRKKYAKIISN